MIAGMSDAERDYLVKQVNAREVKREQKRKAALAQQRKRQRLNQTLFG